MIKFNRVNYFKFVLSLCFIVFFIFVIANADLFDKGQEQLAINPSFVESDDGVSYEINLDNINVNVDDNNDIQYTVQNGDTLLKIAGVFGTTVSSIQKENNLKKNDLEAGQVLKVSNQVDGIVYVVQSKTNVVVFANTYNLNLQDLMTLNYVQDESEIFSPGQEVFINVSKERAYEIGLLERPLPPKPEIITNNRPTINQGGKVVSKSKPKIKTATIISVDDNEGDTPITNRGIISRFTYTKKVKNGFAVGYCTWYAAILRPDIFTYTDESKTNQDRPFGGNANQWCAGAKKAGLSVGSKPSANALVVYSRLRSSAGHVGKVVSIVDAGTMIVQDMNYAGKFVVTKRYEDTNNSAIKCYIY